MNSRQRAKREIPDFPRRQSDPLPQAFKVTQAVTLYGECLQVQMDQRRTLAVVPDSVARSRL
jgi:hypothetical protein